MIQNIYSVLKSWHKSQHDLPHWATNRNVN